MHYFNNSFIGYLEPGRYFISTTDLRIYKDRKFHLAIQLFAPTLSFSQGEQVQYHKNNDYP